MQEEGCSSIPKPNSIECSVDLRGVKVKNTFLHFDGDGSDDDTSPPCSDPHTKGTRVMKRRSSEPIVGSPPLLAELDVGGQSSTNPDTNST